MWWPASRYPPTAARPGILQPGAPVGPTVGRPRQRHSTISQPRRGRHRQPRDPRRALRQCLGALLPVHHLAEQLDARHAQLGDTSPFELGVKFTADFDGTVTGIRFYKRHRITLARLGRKPVVGRRHPVGTGTFYQRVLPRAGRRWSFTSPVTITANTVYVASYSTTTGRVIRFTCELFHQLWRR